ncbi:MAG: PatB family C-S lyase [Caldilineaceae bacterium]|nr:PatB family C-S lyase [Caldilineaceae bacterium]
MSSYNFDQVVNRRGTDSAKWGYFPEALPLWVADMDFRSPQPILDALTERVEEGVFGYALELPELKEAIAARLANRYDWQVTPEEIVFLPGLVSGLNAVSRAIGAPGDGILVNTPVYPPFLTAPENQGRELHAAEQRAEEEGGTLRYTIDFDALETAIRPNTRMFILCNPHNPTGRAYIREELERLADMAARHDLIVCSDEIHCELILDDVKHIPLASLGPDVAARTITLIAPSKTFNVPGLGLSAAIVPNAELRKQLEQGMAGIVPHCNLLGMHAALAAYTQCDDWLAELLAYLRANRDYAVDYIARHMPNLRTTVPEATYLLWIDCRGAGLENPQQFFLEEAGVALNDGTAFGQGGEGFVRLNLGCTRATLKEALDKMTAALG